MPDRILESERDSQSGQRSGNAAVAGAEMKPSRRRGARLDWLILPLIAIAALSAVYGSVAMTMKAKGMRAKSNITHCIQPSPNGLYAIPNSVCVLGDPDGKPVDYRFNACGDRTPIDCRHKADDVFRVVLIGSSVPMAGGIAESKSVAERLSADLSRAAHRDVEVYNSALFGSGGSPANLAFRAPRILALKPDLVLWVFTSYDVSKSKAKDQDQGLREAPQGGRGVQGFVDGSKAAEYVRNLLYGSQSAYMAGYLLRSRDFDLIRRDATVQSTEQLRAFDADVKTMMGYAKSAGVPVAAAFLPDRGESAMLAMSRPPDGFDPEGFRNEVRAILIGEGAAYLDLVPAIQATANWDGAYFPGGDHLNAAGHAALARILADALVRGRLLH